LLQTLIEITKNMFDAFIYLFNRVVLHIIYVSSKRQVMSNI